MQRIRFQIICIMVLSISSCQDPPDLYSDNPARIVEACEYYGRQKDTSAIRHLLIRSLDPRIQGNILHKGHSVNYCRLLALQKISGIPYTTPFKTSGVDTAATLFYLDWAIRNHYIQKREETDIRFYKR